MNLLIPTVNMLDFIKRPFVIGKVYSIDDLTTPKQVLSSIDVRPRIPILIIDDEGFVYKEDLRDEKYNIHCLTIIEDFAAVAQYPIVICDIKGVGTNFDKEREGLFVIRELKKKYPFKQYAVYSGATNYQIDALDWIEGVSRIKKDPEIEDWRSYLDEFIRRATDPKENWKKIRDFLLQKDVPLLDVLLLESSFVDIYNNRPDQMNLFPEEKKFPSITQDIRSIIQSMIAGALLHTLLA